MICDGCGEEYAGGKCAQKPINDDLQFGAAYACQQWENRTAPSGTVMNFCVCAHTNHPLKPKENKMHESTFNYLNPTDKQKEDMAVVRGKFMELVFGMDGFIPDGPDKTYLIRKLRECAMWANVAITRQADGAPRT